MRVRIAVLAFTIMTISCVLAASVTYFGKGQYAEVRVKHMEYSVCSQNEEDSDKERKLVGDRPVGILSHYGFYNGVFQPYAVVEFQQEVGSPSDGEVTNVNGNSVSIKANFSTVITYKNLSSIIVSSNQRVIKGELIGFASSPVNVVVAYYGKAVDPVAVLWPDMSIFSIEASGEEQKRDNLAAEMKKQKQSEDFTVYTGEEVSLDKIPKEIRELMESAAEATGLPFKLIAAVAAVESGFNVHAVSPKGAVGIMQLMPETARGLGVSNPFDPVQNIMAGAKYLRRLVDSYGDLKLALAAYNAGTEAVDKFGGIPPYKETQTYVEKVIKLLE